MDVICGLDVGENQLLAEGDYLAELVLNVLMFLDVWLILSLYHV